MEKVPKPGVVLAYAAPGRAPVEGAGAEVDEALVTVAGAVAAMDGAWAGWRRVLGSRRLRRHHLRLHPLQVQAVNRWQIALPRSKRNWQPLKKR